jgi:hypothetical protein
LEQVPGRRWRLGPLVVALLAVAIGFGAGVSIVRARHQIVALKEAAEDQWRQIETELHRQYELMPGLVKVTRRHTGADAPALDELFAARARYARADAREKPALAGEFEGAMSAVLALADTNRHLRADPAFQDLSSEIVGARTRIAAERARYDELVETLDRRLSEAPWRWVAAGVEPRRL